MLLKKLMK